MVDLVHYDAVIPEQVTQDVQKVIVIDTNTTAYDRSQTDPYTLTLTLHPSSPQTIPPAPQTTPLLPQTTPPSSHWRGSLCCLSTIPEVVVAGLAWSTVHPTCEVLQCGDSHMTSHMTVTCSRDPPV